MIDEVHYTMISNGNPVHLNSILSKFKNKIILSGALFPFIIKYIVAMITLYLIDINWMKRNQFHSCILLFLKINNFADITDVTYCFTFKELTFRQSIRD